MEQTTTPFAQSFAGVTSVVSLAVALVASTVLYEGSWEKVYAETEGTWKITGNAYGTIGRKLELSSDFETMKAPDLKIYLSEEPLADLEDDDATEDAALIGKLQSESGAQTFDIPSTLKLEDYESIFVHSASYAKVWCGADLEEDEDTEE